VWGARSQHEGPVVHVGFADPYCPRGRAAAIDSVRVGGHDLADSGTLVVVNGPRFSSRAESRMHQQAGFTIVGMTTMPEAALARELGLPYVAICVVVNHAAGRGDSAGEVSMEGISQVLETGMDKVRALLDHVVVRMA
jgi:5'-methylthioadenosine phosphorylase